MPIAKRPQNARKVQPDDAAAEAFIAGAGKPAASDTAPPRTRKERVMTQFDAEVLARVDKAAKRRGISRSAWIQFVVSRALDQGEG
jgi:hypothetical protein